jgi:carboxyl-terminal processing protease
MTGLAISIVLLAPAAPVPNGTPPPPVSAKLDPIQVTQFANLVENLANRIRDYYVRDSLTPKELLEGAVRGLYEEVGQPVPDAVKAAITRASTQIARLEVLREVRSLLGDHPNLRGSRALFAAMNGFQYATDPICHLASPRASSYASIDQDFGVGIELDGVVGTRWAIYQVEHRVALGMIAPVGYFGPPPKRDEVPSPAVFPWRIKRVIPGSPAQKAGVKPGDLITHLNSVEITAENVDKQFALFAMPRQVFDPRTGQALPQDRTVTFRRGDDKPFTATLKSGLYNPESAFGVMRIADDKWDCMLDRKAKIGYIRVGAIEMGLDARFADMMSDLAKQGCRGLILDLRWCPGGYVDPGTRIAGLFLPDGSVISKMVFTHPERSGAGGDVLAPPGGGKYATLPLVVLVGHETTGGGELIASALRDNNRCVVIGQRTVGRATIQNFIDAGFGGVQFRVTTGTSLRPNGKNRQRTPTSQPTDDWGIRPDDGLEVPITADKAAELRQQADLHALRPAGSREALPFDEPAEDPFRVAALKYLRTRLGPTK